MKKELYYTAEKNIQLVISLLKRNNISRIIVSPGATNVTFVGSIQNDSFFKIYSCIDERSAAYMACGMAAESGEPVVINCTGATSSRNWMPALTEAYYSKLPILAITSSQESNKIGHLIAQITDRTSPPKDTVINTYQIDLINNENDEWDRTIKVNSAIHDLISKRGPVHLNLITNYNDDFSIKELPDYKLIKRYTEKDDFPQLPSGKIAIFIGQHRNFTIEETNIIDKFCEANNSIVICDHTSGYKGQFSIHSGLAFMQNHYTSPNKNIDLIIHIGEISGDYYGMKFVAKKVWRVNEDGIIRDTFKKIDSVFEMNEILFFSKYINAETKCNSFYNNCIDEYNYLYKIIPELPFSNIWIAKVMSPLLPINSHIYLGILNTLRSWNFFYLPQSVTSNSNVGGFGIDGILSSMIGASLVNSNKIYYAVLGDLSFFYDMNILGNHHIGNNVRILIINNGKGQEFRNPLHPANKFGDEADKYIAAANHFGSKSKQLVKNFAENLGFKYLKASNKNEFIALLPSFVSPEISQSIIYEVFIDGEEDGNALNIMLNLQKDKTSMNISHKIKTKLKSIINN